MRRNLPIFIGGMAFITLFIQLIVGVLTNWAFNFLTFAVAPVQQFVTASLVLLIWLVLNHVYFQQRISWRFDFRHWYLVLPVAVVVIGDIILQPHNQLTLGTILWALALGLVVALTAAYIFCGLVVNFARDQFRLSPSITAMISGFIFAVGLSVSNRGANLLNTSAQLLAAFGVGFFFAAVYLLTKNLWWPLIGQTIIVSFSKITFGLASNVIGVGLITSVIYAVVFTLLGVSLLNKSALQQRVRRERQPTFTKRVERQPIALVKTVIACLIVPVELALAPQVIKLAQHQLGRAILMDLVFFIGFCVAVWLFRDVLKSDWQRFKQHWFIHSLWAIGGVFVSYAILAAVRWVLKPLAVGTTPDLLSVQTATVGLIASLTVLMAPFTEEIIFRHVLFYQWRRRGILTWLMFILSAVLFGLAHWNNFDGNVLAMVPYMAVGAWYALIYYWSRDIWQNILTHFLFDIIQFLGALLVLVVALLQG
ncbi:CPBP family intramembrane glutamic endopeptidase [Loigolactobacillus jiayinensis]|uniref:CPBP family intramembrane glutamic endopeptidase n=1 Tax=Loigolactobacillus jiayinensis TaxID=2486016 RepID=A0ABW1RDD5_9LACO|nr:type II CAAX endopeptidase family protein [Loigolactobacillus jiayinensis]